ncbi:MULTISPECIES: TrmH family RNA methyltransferase [Pseudoalteromonas]|uniref:RNA methyltransferase n=1 Tax=Pseudoalteromonas amylolytica TaxID=1859457 RepID=A0A1S1MQK2_9GAMM|nr:MULTISPECIES: RNA methyltransferase [Pseudoalteromonas]OHU85780.1 RNA methyltransferase [Pseudoalteromonas sp. JW3]OHU87318.1 RNA methyltransferase [Pseudoalteromonas amylolytica]
MISKNQLKLLRALAQKKYRKQHGLYLVQGEKNVLELLGANIPAEQLFASAEFIAKHQSQLEGINVIEADSDSLTKASTLTSNNAAIAVVQFPDTQPIDRAGMILALDGVSDPGNLGTIIRVADWYGFKQIVLSEECADHLNPKVISATMGSFVRVSVVRTNLVEFLADYDGAIYGAYLDGQSVHSTQFATQGVLVMGSESHGISEQVGQYINSPITIPAFGGAESLNVAMATGIILDNIKRGS